MKKYYSLGELLKAYRGLKKISQAEFSIKMNSDIRTIQRWEKNETTINEDKVSELIDETLLPLQLIRNLNANDPIPIFFDFNTWKYSLTELAIELPEASWYKRKMGISTERLRKMDLSYDFDFVVNAMAIPQEFYKNLKEVFREAIFHLPELNLIITDELGNYSGFSIILPINQDAYELMKQGGLSANNLEVKHIQDQNFQEIKTFFCFKLTADSNDNMQYLIGAVLSYFKTLNEQDYVYCDFEYREDAFHLPAQLGLIEYHSTDSEKGSVYFYEGDFKNFLRED